LTYICLFCGPLLHSFTSPQQPTPWCVFDCPRVRPSRALFEEDSPRQPPSALCPTLSSCATGCPLQMSFPTSCFHPIYSFPLPRFPHQNPDVKTFFLNKPSPRRVTPRFLTPPQPATIRSAHNSIQFGRPLPAVSRCQ